MNLPKCPNGCIPMPRHNTTLFLSERSISEHICISCGWIGQPLPAGEINHSFLFNMIRKLNRAKRQTQKDVVLHAVGVNVGLLKRNKSILPTLSQEERERVYYFLNQFLVSQGFEES